MNNNEIPIIIRIYDLYKIYYQYLELFPKKDKYALGKKCEELIIGLLESALIAKNSPPEEKKPAVKTTSVKLDLLKIFIRLCKDLKLLDQKKYIPLKIFCRKSGG